MIFAFVGIR